MATTAPTQKAPHAGRTRFYVTMSFVAIAIATAGFLPGLLNSAGRLAPVTPLVAVHGVVSFAWLILFFVQTALVTAGRTDLHRRLGIATAALIIPMIMLGYFSAIAMTRRGFDLSGDLNIKSNPLFQLIFPLGDLVVFGGLAGAALLFRRRPEVHKRLMLMGVMGPLMVAPVAHFTGHNLRSAPNAFIPIFGVLLLVPAIYDRIRFGSFHPVTLWGGLAIFFFGNIRATMIGPSTAWHEFAAWLIR